MSSDLARLRFELRLLQRAGVRRLLPIPRSAPPEGAPPRLEEREDEPRRPRPPREAAAKALEATVPSPAERHAPSSRPKRPPPGTAAERGTRLEQLAERVRACEACKLCEKRSQAVPGEGALDPPILFIGEGPGRDEDRSGRPFVGRAGQLLDKMIAAIGLQRAEVFIANIVKCRPPANRTPEPDEVRACFPYLEEQVEILQPRLICSLGLPATRSLVPKVTTISAARGRQFVFRGIPLIPTFHPAYLLRNPSAKRQAWTDLKLVARLALGKELDR